MVPAEPQSGPKLRKLPHKEATASGLGALADGRRATAPPEIVPERVQDPASRSRVSDPRDRRSHRRRRWLTAETLSCTARAREAPRCASRIAHELFAATIPGPPSKETPRTSRAIASDYRGPQSTITRRRAVAPVTSKAVPRPTSTTAASRALPLSTPAAARQVHTTSCSNSHRRLPRGLPAQPLGAVVPRHGGSAICSAPRFRRTSAHIPAPRVQLHIRPCEQQFDYDTRLTCSSGASVASLTRARASLLDCRLERLAIATHARTASPRFVPRPIHHTVAHRLSLVVTTATGIDSAPGHRAQSAKPLLPITPYALVGTSPPVQTSSASRPATCSPTAPCTLVQRGLSEQAERYALQRFAATARVHSHYRAHHWHTSPSPSRLRLPTWALHTFVPLSATSDSQSFRQTHRHFTFADTVRRFRSDRVLTYKSWASTPSHDTTTSRICTSQSLSRSALPITPLANLPCEPRVVAVVLAHGGDSVHEVAITMLRHVTV